MVDWVRKYGFVQAILSFFLIILLVGCGGGGGDGGDPSSSDSGGSPAASGAITFELQFKPSSVDQADGNPEAGIELDVCRDYHIDTIEVDVHRASDLSLVENVIWDCSTHAGDVYDLPTETHLYAIYRAIVDGQTSWYAQVNDLVIPAGGDLDIGTIVLDYVGDDTTAPAVVSIHPADGASDVDVNTTISAVFNEPLAINSITDQAILVSSDDGPFAGRLSYDAETYTIGFEPDESLEADTDYTVALSPAIANTVGIPIDAHYSWSFVTAQFDLKTYTISASAGAGGSITPSGSVSVNHGATQSFNIAANSGYHITDVNVDGVSQGAITSYSFSNVTGDHTISASFAVDTYTITASAGAGGSITPLGSVSVNHGATQSFSIAADAGYQITDVTVDGVSRGARSSYSFTNVTGDHTISASFAIDTYTITASAGTGGTITPSGSVSVNHGANQSFSIAADSGYRITNVTVDGVSRGARSSYSFTNVTGDHTISASFAVDTYTITASAGIGGTITPSGSVSVNHGATQSFSIAADSGYRITNVTVDGVSQGARSSYSFTNVTGDHTISASFAIDTYTITASAGTGGTITPSGSVSVNHGANQSFSIAADSGYRITNVTVDGVSQGARSSYSFTNVTGDHTISASFAVSDTVYYYIVNELTGHKLRPWNAADGALIVQAPAGWTDDWVQWYLVETGSGFFYLKNKATEKHIAPESIASGSYIVQEPETLTDNWAQWELIDFDTAQQLEPGTTGVDFCLQNRETEEYVDTSGLDNMESGSDYYTEQIWVCHSLGATWELQEVTP